MLLLFSKNAITLSKNVILNLRRNGAGFLQSGVLAPSEGYAHGDMVTVTSLATASDPVTKRGFLGGPNGLIESQAVSATIPENTDWKFTIASHNPVVFNDSTRRKVAKNDYFAQADIDACHSFVFGTPLALGQTVYSSRWIKPVIKTTGGVDYPVLTQTLQLKLDRFNTAFDIVDTASNTGTEIGLFRGWGAQSSVLRTETGDGLLTGTATSGNSTTLTDSSKNFGVNTLKNRGLQITGGTGVGQFGLITSNTATSITTQFGFSPAPDATTTYEIQSGTTYPANDDIDVNQGWQREENIVTVNATNTANGVFLRRIQKADGYHVTVNKTDMTFCLGAARLNYLHFQNYYGSNSVPMTLREMYSDDVYVQIGSSTRLVITDNVSPDLSTVYEIQNPLTWSSNTATFNLNTGGIPATGAYFLHEITGLNTVLSTRAITIGALGG